MSKSKDSNAPSAVLDYLNKQNRPYSAIDICNNLHKEFGKTAIVKACESLAAEGRIREKVYGKQKCAHLKKKLEQLSEGGNVVSPEEKEREDIGIETDEEYNVKPPDL
ncbi:HOP2-like protein [Mya arenaria]|uniref:HOP2-like protein n=1 Tax=Mya arenaria TaxID=6604 RepID=A0ABY7DAV8_MYAAR|nr:HOP2-like protein [Mya arenaria]